jgi:SNF2 family DNA or RNA helicase
MLAMDMGTGKTRAAIELIAAYRFATVLIICPHTVVSVWPEQIQRWSSVPMRVLALDKGTVKRRTQLAQQHLDELARDPSPHILVINSEAARADEFAVFALKRAWDLVILDESHRIKDPHGYTAKFAGLLGRRATCRLALTDTPMPHSPLDVYAQFRFVDPSVYGVSWMRFRARYAVMGGFNGKEVVGYRHLDELHRKFYALAYRVQAEDVLDLPEQIFVTRTATMTGHGASTYRRLERDLIAEVDEGVVTVANALTKLLRLAQVTSGFVPDDDGREHDIDDAKATLLAEVLDELAPHEPVVVFARFHHDLDTIATIARAQGRTVAELSGRVNELALWQAGQRDVLAAQIQSGPVQTTRHGGYDVNRSSPSNLPCSARITAMAVQPSRKPSRSPKPSSRPTRKTGPRIMPRRLMKRRSS